jgi:hypothetical protein
MTPTLKHLILGIAMLATAGIAGVLTRSSQAAEYGSGVGAWPMA